MPSGGHGFKCQRGVFPSNLERSNRDRWPHTRLPRLRGRCPATTVKHRRRPPNSNPMQITRILNELHAEDSQENEMVPSFPLSMQQCLSAPTSSDSQPSEIHNPRHRSPWLPNRCPYVQHSLTSPPEQQTEATRLRKQVAALGFSPSPSHLPVTNGGTDRWLLRWFSEGIKEGALVFIDTRT